MDKHTLVFIHGFAEDSRIWDAQKEHFQDKYRVITPNLPGSGPNARPITETSTEELAEDVKIQLNNEGVKKCTLICHSMGGYVALAFAALYPNWCEAFAPIHSTAYPDSEEKKAARRKGIEFIRKNGSAAFIRQSTPNLFSETARKQHPEWIAALIDRYAGFHPDTLIAYYEAMIRRPDRTEVLKNFAGPVLFVIGEQDTTIPLTTSLEQSHMPDRSYIHILKDSAHMGMMEQSSQVNKILENFLKDLYE